MEIKHAGKASGASKGKMDGINCGVLYKHMEHKLLFSEKDTVTLITSMEAHTYGLIQ